MPVYLIYVLVALACGAALGLGYKIGNGFGSMLTLVGLIVVLRVLWEPAIKPLIERVTKKNV